LGGTKIEGAVIDPSRPDCALCRLRLPTESAKGYAHIIRQIVRLVAMLERKSGSKRPAWIGFGTPGVVDPGTGVLKNSNTTCLNGRRLREDLGARLVVLYMGRLDPEKRVTALVDSFLSLGLPDDHVLCIAGDGVQRRVLGRVAAGHPNVRVLGLVTADRALHLLRGCDVFVLPSTAEGLALSLLEAMAAGCAVVATDAGEDGRALDGAGVVIPVHPLRPALDEALRSLVSDAALRARLGGAARRRAVERYGMAAHSRRVLAVYTSATEGAAEAPGRVRPAALP